MLIVFNNKPLHIGGVIFCNLTFFLVVYNIDERVNLYNAFLLIHKFIMCIFIMMLNGNCLTVSKVLGGLNYGKQ